MDLRIKDVVDMLQVSEKTVYRWIKDRKIPCYKINHQYRFNRAEINEWILSNKIELSSQLMDVSNSMRSTDLYELLNTGGVLSDIQGNNVKTVLRSAIETIKTPAKLSKEEIIKALLSREEMMTTAVGRGIAVPHARTPIVTAPTDEQVSICYLKNPVDFGALDGKPVKVLFIILTSSPRRHLDVLSKISYLCHLDSFVDMLNRQASKDELLDFIETKEFEWRK
jgi:PTS system nitrogen regulatory IIA component